MSTNTTANKTTADQPITNPVSQVNPQTNATSASVHSPPIDGPPPAYEMNDSSASHQPQSEESNVNSNVAAATAFEAPPPYCLVDPTKIQNSDHLPRYPQISPLEIIDLSPGIHHNSEQTNHQQNNAAISAWLASGSNMDIGTDCTFLMAFIIAFFFNWLGFLAVVCLIPTIAARFGAMSGFGLSVAKWITVMRYHDFNNSTTFGPHTNGSLQRPPTPDPAHNFVFAIVLFAGFFLFVRGLISYIAVKNRAHQQGQTADVFTWY